MSLANIINKVVTISAEIICQTKTNLCVKVLNRTLIFLVLFRIPNVLNDQIRHVLNGRDQNKLQYSFPANTPFFRICVTYLAVLGGGLNHKERLFVSLAWLPKVCPNICRLDGKCTLAEIVCSKFCIF